MTLERVIATGSGRLCARVEIEGLPIQFVSDPGMEQTDADGRVRVHCFRLFGEGASTFTIEESVNIPEAVLEAQGANLRLWETADEVLSQALHYAPSIELHLSAKVAAADTSMTLRSTTGLSSGDVVHIGTEAIKLGAAPGATSITSLTRGYWGTIARDIWTIDDASGRTPYAILTDRPLRIRGRRVRLYLYGDGDDLTGDGGNGGDPVWRGMVTSEPRWDQAGTSVSLSFGPLTKLLESKLGGDLDSPAYPRGIYYSWAAPLRIQIRTYDGIGGSTYNTLLFVGFYETQLEFIDALTVELAAMFGSQVAAVLTADGGWTIENTCTTTGGATVDIWSAQDGQTSRRIEDMLDSDGVEIGDSGFAVGQRIYASWVSGPPGARQVPRGYFGRPPDAPTSLSSVPTATATWPEHRIYLGSPVAADWTAVAVAWAGASGSVYTLGAAADTTNNAVSLASVATEAGSPPDVHCYTSALQAEVKARRRLAYGSLTDLRSALITESLTYADRGTAPFITSDDLASWTAPLAAAEQFAWQRQRFYSIGASVELDKLLAAEFMLRGVYPITDSSGKISLASIRVPSTTEAVDWDIDEEIVSVGRASMERGMQTVNHVFLARGYDPIEDDWTLGDIDVFDVRSYALDHQDRSVRVEPRSVSYSGDGRIDPNEVAAAFLPLTAVFGYPHDFVAVNVSWKLFDARLGDVVTFSAAHLPDRGTGTRPVTDVRGTITRRRWTIGEAHGELTLLMSWTSPSGYSPSAVVTSQSNTSGDTWALTAYGFNMPSGTALTDWFAASDRVRIRKRDSETASAINGTVTTVTSTVITVTFDSTWTPGADSWGLGFAPYTDGSITAAQQSYAAIAGDDNVLGASDRARSYGA